MGSAQEKIKEKIKAFLRFSAQHAGLADAIAEEASGRLMQAEADRMGRVSRVSPDRLIELETRACIRHAYTGYDDVLIENTLEQADIVRGAFGETEPDKAIDEVTAFIQRHRDQPR